MDAAVEINVLVRQRTAPYIVWTGFTSAPPRCKSWHCRWWQQNQSLRSNRSSQNSKRTYTSGVQSTTRRTCISSLTRGASFSLIPTGHWSTATLSLIRSNWTGKSEEDHTYIQPHARAQAAIPPAQHTSTTDRQTQTVGILLHRHRYAARRYHAALNIFTRRNIYTLVGLLLSTDKQLTIA